MLELTDCELNTPVTNRLRALMDKQTSLKNRRALWVERWKSLEGSKKKH